MTTYAISGASGNLGRLIADAALERVAASDLVLLTRDPSRLASYAERGAEVRRADFTDAASLGEALTGIDRLVLISLDVVGERLPHQLAAVDAAAAAGVRWAAYTSILDPSDSNPVGVGEDHRTTEDRLRASGMAWTFLRNSIYAEMLAPTAQGALATGTLTVNSGGGGTSFVSRADCAAVAAAVLASDEWDGKALDVTGPEALDAEAQAALIGAAAGREISVTQLDDEAWVRAMTEHAGLPEPVARLLATFGTAARRGYSDTVSTVVRDLTGRDPAHPREVLAGLL